MNRRHMVSIGVGALVSGALLVAAVWNVDFGALADTLARARLGYAATLVLGALLCLAIRAQRWRLLLPAKGAPLRTYFRLVTIGLAVNNVLPLRLGELVRSLFAAEELKLPLLTVLASVFIERLLDALTILSLFMAAASVHADSPWVVTMRPALVPLFAAVCAVFAGAFLIETVLERSHRLSALLNGHPRLRRLVDQVILGFKPLKSPATLAQILLWGLALWLTDAGNFLMGSKAVPLGQDLSYFYAMVILASAGFSTVVPTLPGYIGAFELVVSQSLLPLGVGEEQAFGYAVLVHMVAYVVVTTLGIWFLYRDGTSLMDVWRRAHQGHEHRMTL